ELLEAALHSVRETRCLAARIVQDEHSHGARLSVSQRRERERSSSAGGLPQGRHDPVELRAWTRSEERERDVEALDRPAALEVTPSPHGEGGHDVLRQEESKEEPEPLIRLD